jgi:DNA-directed RNA polymerase III subunit RPC1
MRRSLRIHQVGSACLPYWVFQSLYHDAARHLQGEAISTCQVLELIFPVSQTCSRVLLSEEDRRKYLRLFRRPGLENLQRASLAKQVNTACRKVLKCPYCTSLNGVVKKAGPLKITHERFRQKSTRDELEEFKKGFAGAIKEQRELGGLLSKAHEDIHPLRCLDLFRKVSAEDCELLGLKPDIGRPEDYIWQYISVPSPCIRPSVAQEAATNEDDLTVKLSEIIYANQLINASLAKGQGVQQIMVSCGTIDVGKLATDLLFPPSRNNGNGYNCRSHSTSTLILLVFPKT